MNTFGGENRDKLQSDEDERKGRKDDAGKPRMDLLSGVWLMEVAKVLTFGAQKYGDHNWRKGIHTSRLFGAAMRHLWAWNQGEDVDPETRLSHLAHASCCLMFMMELLVIKPGVDDRYRSQ